jgi:MFS family permease
MEKPEIVEIEDTTKSTLSQKLSLVFASIALGSDGYQANVIGAVESCLTKIYGSDLLSNGLSTRISNAMLIGDIVGQVGFGVLIDRLGRKFGIIACTAFVCLVSSIMNLYWCNLTVLIGYYTCDCSERYITDRVDMDAYCSAWAYRCRRRR